MAFETDGQSITDVVPTREYTLQELRLLSKAAGFRDEVATYGALDPEFVAADDDELAYRLVVVLTARRVDGVNIPCVCECLFTYGVCRWERCRCYGARTWAVRRRRLF